MEYIEANKNSTIIPPSGPLVFYIKSLRTINGRPINTPATMVLQNDNQEERLIVAGDPYGLIEGRFKILESVRKEDFRITVLAPAKTKKLSTGSTDFGIIY